MTCKCSPISATDGAIDLARAGMALLRQVIQRQAWRSRSLS